MGEGFLWIEAVKGGKKVMLNDEMKKSVTDIWEKRSLLFITVGCEMRKK